MIRSRRRTAPKLEMYVLALEVAARTVENELLKDDLLELREHILKSRLTWREKMGGRDHFLEGSK